MYHDGASPACGKCGVALKCAEHGCFLCWMCETEEESQEDGGDGLKESSNPKDGGCRNEYSVV